MSDTHAHSSLSCAPKKCRHSHPSQRLGPVKWVQDNLFATPANGLTLHCALRRSIWSLASLPWIFNGIWTAKS